ncbi:MAG: flippase [Patescibacteria group bacterium]|nr:flippase [Patescibacteria group bacterium]
MIFDYLNWNFVKIFYKSPTRKKLLGNFFSLSFLQVTEYVFPLITFPYLVRVLGPANFGFVAFAQAFVGYFQILTDYGFNLSATREISINSQNKRKISEIFSSVMFIKFVLMLISFLMLILIIFLFPKFHNDWLIYIYTFGTILGGVLFPIWLFQGLEKMKYITILSIISKLIFLVGIFIFIRNSSDFYFVPILVSIGVIVAGIISMFIVFIKFKIKIVLPNFSNIKFHLIDGWHIFLSTIAISLYTVSNTFILGLMTNDVVVGYYSAAEKIVRAAQGILNPVSQAIYPHFSKLYVSNKKAAASSLKKILYLVGVFTFFVSVVISIFAPFISNLLLGRNFTESIPILRILIFIVFAIGLNNILGTQGLLAFGFKKSFTKIVGFFSIFHVVSVTILIYLFSSVGVAIATLATEMLISVTMFYSLRKRRIL